MKRWHEERNLMLRRWREEIHNHADDRWQKGSYRRAPIPPTVCNGDEPCHCFRGPGFMRKQRPHGCSRPRCGICHGDKHYGYKARANKKRAAIRFEMEATA